jgi:DNA polymerase III epsilon subunit-like protein
MSVPIYMIDFEGSANSGILEYGVVEIIDAKICRTWTRLCRPTGRIAKRDRLTHGLSAQDLSHCLPIEEDWDFFSGLRESGVLAAHHAAFESALIKTVWPCPRLAADFTKHPPNQTQKVAQWGPWIDSLALYRRFYSQVESYKLDTLVQQFQLQDDLSAHAREHCPANRQNFHRALYDAIASALLLQILFQLPDFHFTTVADWIHWSITPNKARTDPQLSLNL